MENNTNQNIQPNLFDELSSTNERYYTIIYWIKAFLAIIIESLCMNCEK